MKKIFFVYLVLIAFTIKGSEASDVDYAKIVAKKERRKNQNRKASQRARHKKNELIRRLEASIYKLTRETARQASTINQQTDKLIDHVKTIKKQEAQLTQLQTLCVQLRQEKDALEQEKSLLANQITYAQTQQLFDDSLLSNQPSSLIFKEEEGVSFDEPTFRYQCERELTLL